MIEKLSFGLLAPATGRSETSGQMRTPSALNGRGFLATLATLASTAILSVATSASIVVLVLATVKAAASLANEALVATSVKQVRSGQW